MGNTNISAPITLTDFDYALPDELIAQMPVHPRDQSRLLVFNSDTAVITDRQFRDLAEYLGPDDFLIMNDARVLPVRMLGHRAPTESTPGHPGSPGGAVEALLLRKISDREWRALLHMSAKVKPGVKIIFEPGVVAEVLSTHEERLASEGEVRLRFSGIALDRPGATLERWLERHGHVPLPPYISRDDQAQDKQTYQTVYAQKLGSAAAPTAGFHFTDELLEKLRAKGVQTAAVTLHVGIGTFRPIKTENLDEHVMHEEIYEITPEFVEVFERALREKKRIVAVGTTVVRALESWAQTSEYKKPGVFSTRAFIKPGVPFRVIDALITNFHLPRSSLLLLVAAAVGVDRLKKIYAHAVNQRYRFFSYGDAMFITKVSRL